MIFGSVCSGIEAASVAWHPLGWRAAFLSEIEAFPRSVLTHHFPDVPLHGDFTTIEAGQYDAIDLLVGGTPCQSFSIAGLRGGLADDRGNLALEYLRLADRLRPRWLVWENVPGVLSSNGGRDFGAILAGMVECGYGFAYRVLDAQHFGVPQRRRRVFVVGYLGDWRRAAAVLFERHSLHGHPAPRREAGKVAPTIPSRSTGGGGLGTDFDCDGGLQVAGTMMARKDSGGWSNSADHAAAGYMIPVKTLCVATGQAGAEIGADMAPTLNCNHEAPYVAHALRGEGFDASEDGTGRGTPLVPVPILEAGARTGKSTTDIRAGIGIGEPGDPMFTLQSGKQHAIAFSSKDHGADAGETSPTLRAGGHSKSHANAGVPPAVAFDLRGREDGAQFEGPHDSANIRAASGGSSRSYVASTAVRRLTPKECERLQGFPDDWTLVPHRGKPAADGPRYKALGNSMAIPVVRWLGERIQKVEDLCSPAKTAA